MFKLDINNINPSNVKEIALVPSPAEMQKALSRAGLQSKLADLALSEKSIAMNTENQDQLAIRCGVVLAELVLTVKTAPKEKMLSHLAALKVGFTKLGAGDKFLKTIDTMSSNIKTDAKSRDDLLKDMDSLAGIMVPELEKELGKWVVPLVQAGSWLKGANLVAGAINEEQKYDAATRLLKQPQVVDYFLKYVQREGTKKAPDEIVQKLEFALLNLKKIASKDKLNQADVKAIQSDTTEVLLLL